MTPQGLFCREGGFHIDPWQPVARAVVTHAHSDHASAGSGAYLCSRRGVGVLGLRVGTPERVSGLAWGEAVELGSVRVSLHPAGHILGSAQVRIECVGGEVGPRGRVCVISGDYKTDPDPTCDAFEPVACHTFISESTFGLPIYRWTDQGRVMDDLNAWWRENQAAMRTSLMLAYALGKAQRVLAGLDRSIGPIGAHGSVRAMTALYRAEGIDLPEIVAPGEPGAADVRGVGLVVAPPSVVGTPWLRRLASGKAEGVATAMASGWMRVRGSRRRQAIDRGFVLSDHADWPALHAAITATGAERVGVTHGSIGPMVRTLRERGLDAFGVPTRFTGETAEDSDEPVGTGEAPTPNGAGP